MDSKKILWIAVCLFFVSTVSCMRCYVCNSYYDGDNCISAEKLKDASRFLRNCSDLPEGERYTYCRKTVQHNIPTQNNGFETRIVRECGFLNTTMNCQKMGMNDVSGQFMCSCSEDGCNSSSQLTPKMAFLSLLTMVVGSTFRP